MEDEFMIRYFRFLEQKANQKLRSTDYNKAVLEFHKKEVINCSSTNR